MKLFRGTYILAALVALLAGYTFWEYKHSNDQLDAAVGERMAFSLKRDEVDRIELTSKGVTTELRREGGAWKMVKPVEDQAESSSIEGYLFSILAQKLKTFRGEDEAKGGIKWSDFGLEPAATVITLSGKGKSEALQIASKNAYDGSFYVRVGDELLLGDRGLAQIGDRQVSSFRSRHLWRQDDAVLQSVKIENSVTHEAFGFKKQDKSWVMDPKPSFSFDPHLFEVWVNKVQDLLPNDIIKESIGDEDRTQDLLVKPSAVITVEYKNKDGKDGQWILTLGQDKAGEVYLFTNQRPTLYKTNKASVDPLRVGKAYFRNGKLPFEFDVEAAREVRLNTDKFKHTIKKVDGNWVLADQDAKFEINQENLVQLFTNLRSLEAQEFGEAGKGFKAAPQLQILDEKGKVLFALSWGDEYKAKSPWLAGASLRFVQTSLGGKSALGVDKAKVDGLISPALVTAKKAPLPVKAEKK